MQMQKRQLKSMSDVREKQEKGQRNLMFSLMKYEDIGMAYYSD